MTWRASLSLKQLFKVNISYCFLGNFSTHGCFLLFVHAAFGENPIRCGYDSVLSSVPLFLFLFIGQCYRLCHKNILGHR